MILDIDYKVFDCFRSRIAFDINLKVHLMFVHIGVNTTYPLFTVCYLS